MSDQQGQTPQWPPQQPFQQPPYRQQQSSYTQPTQAHPGQFQQPPYNSFPPQQKRQGLWGWYNPRTRTVKLSLGCAAILAMLLVSPVSVQPLVADIFGDLGQHAFDRINQVQVGVDTTITEIPTRCATSQHS